jgi:Na+-transporting methylmalonyl-CoA/oxaloacetate decarboxylase gamma subunit
MIIETVFSPDSLQTVKDTLTTAQSSKVFNEIKFDISNVFSGDGLFISFVGYLIVFCALVMLYLVFTNLSKILQLNIKKKLKASGTLQDEKDELSISGEISAAISAALYLHFREIHDFETTVLTIKKVQRPYSPWSSKIYGLREYPRK